MYVGWQISWESFFPTPSRHTRGDEAVGEASDVLCGTGEKWNVHRLRTVVDPDRRRGCSETGKRH